LDRGQKFTEFWILCLILIIACANSIQECIGDVISMNERVLVKMTGRPKAFLQNEITKFETLFRETFNSMTLSSCVGGSYITIQSVKIQSSYLNVAEIYDQMDDSIDQTFTIRLTIDGTCRGCNKDSLFSQNFRQLNTIADIYTKSWIQARPTNSPLFVSTRKQGKQPKKNPNPSPKKGGKAPKGGKTKSSPAPTPPLPCPICLPPFPIFFLTSLQMNFQGLRNTGEVATIDSIESITELDEIFCEDTIQTFKTDVFGLFSGDMDLADDTKVLRLEQVFLETYNSLNLLNEATCDAYFHQIIKVKAKVNVEFNSINGVFPISSQTKNRFSVQFKITCKCRGCDPDASIFSAAGVSAKNIYGIMNPKSSSQKNQFMVMLQRGIQQDACFCARDAEFRTPTIKEFRLALEGNINRTLELGISNTMRNDGRSSSSSSENQSVTPFTRNVDSTVFIEKVVRLSEVDAVDCPQQIDFFEDVVEIVIFGDPDSLTKEGKATLEALFVASFNEAQEGFCDPFFRTITNATLIDSLDRRNLQTKVNKTKSYKVLFRIVGYCRACPKRGLFQNDAIKSRLLLGDAMIWDEINHRGDHHHHLQETTNECYCAINAIANNRTLTEEEFRFVYSRNVDGINGIDNVLNVDGFITASPSQAPSLMPSTSPTSNPSLDPSSSPSITPSLIPTESPSQSPSISPTRSPSRSPSNSPSRMPSNKPSAMPSVEPSMAPSLLPTVVPSLVPTFQPSERPIVSKSTTPQPTNQLKRPPTTPLPTLGLRRPG
jgi:hypothetical protein